jgi:hypothetical protein
MNETANGTGGTGPSHRSVEAGVGVTIAILGFITVFGSLQVGIGWGDEGPKAGFIPFYIGLIILASCAVNLFQLFAAANDNARFATWGQILKVLSVVIPTAVYVTVIPFTGIYVASTLLIALFMMWLGKYRWTVAVPVALAMPLTTFVLFERWFLVPLPKGPIERLLGF